MSENDVITGTLEAGTVLQGRYVIEEIIGQGGFGITYRAKDTRVDVPVAVKEYIPQRQLSEKEAERETKLAAKFYDLEGVASARDYFTEGNHFYIVMEYVKGISVKQYISQQGRMTGEETLQKMRPILESLGKIHEEGVIHRDISADNLMITEGNKLKLVDFGTARFTEEYLDKTHTLIFKRGFAPVEQYRSRGKQGPWTDIYSLCATMYFMITGMLPDDAVERMIDDRTKSLNQIQGTGLSEKEASCIMKGLAVRPEDRYQNIREFYENLYQKDWYEGLKMVQIEKDEKVKSAAPFTSFSTTSLLNEIKSMRKVETRKKQLPRILLLVLFIGIVAWGLGMWSRRSENEAVIPQNSPMPTVEATAEISPTAEPMEEVVYKINDYIGLTKKQLKEKTKELRKAGLKIEYTYKYSDKVKGGKIISQKPAEGKKYKDVSDITLAVIVSKGEKPQATPVQTAKSTPVPTKNPEKKKEDDINFSGDLDKLLR